MSEVHTQARFARSQNLFRTVLIFGLAGPPIGLALMIGGAIAAALVGPHGPHFDPLGLLKNLPEFMQFLLLAAPFSYVMGGLQAFAAGALVAAYGRLIAKPHYWVAALAGLMSFGIMLIIWPQQTIMGNALMAPVHIVAALICWHIAKRFWTATT
jgi:hypothetical protein